MDFYKDLLVPRKQDFSKTFLKMCLIALAATIIVWSLILLGSLAAIVIIGIIYFTWYIIKYFDIEYEYIVTNGELDVDIIYGKKTRKRLGTANSKNIEILAPYTDDVKINGEIKKKFDASSGIKENKKYYVIFNHREHGRTLIIFEPTTEMLENIKFYCRSKVTI